MKVYQLSVVCVALLAGCAPKVAEWTPAESPKENLVKRTVFTHTLHVPAHATELAKKEKNDLLSFLKRTVQRPSAVSVLLEEYGGHSEQRVGDIKRELLKFGIPAGNVSVEEDSQKSSHHKSKKSGSGVNIIVERYFVIPPACADHSQPIGTALQDFSHSNYGCASAVNLGVMVADPRDLIRGRDLEGSDATVMATGVHRYRTDKIKPLIDTSTNQKPSSSSSGSSQSGGAGASLSPGSS